MAISPPTLIPLSRDTEERNSSIYAHAYLQTFSNQDRMGTYRATACDCFDSNYHTADQQFRLRYRDLKLRRKHFIQLVVGRSASVDVYPKARQ
jgi:hypothetical protein